MQPEKTILIIGFFFSFFSLVQIASASPIASVSGTPQIVVESQDYIDKYFTWDFSQINSTYWIATFTINPDLWSDVKYCKSLAQIDQPACWSTFKSTWFPNYDLTELVSNLKDMINYPRENLTKNIKFSGLIIDLESGSGSFYIIFPNGFKAGERAKFGFGSTIVGTSTVSSAIDASNQRKSFFVHGRHWVFFSDGSNMVYSTSEDGISWGEKITMRTAVTDGEWFSIWFDGRYVHYAMANATANSPLYYRRGEPMPDGLISWSDVEQTAVAASTSAYHYPFVSTDSSDYTWISYRISTVSLGARVTKSGYNNGTWGTTAGGFPYTLSSTDASWYTSVVPLTDGKMLVVYSRSGTTYPCYGRSWTGSAWNSEASIPTGYCYTSMYSVVGDGNDAHLVFNSYADNDIRYSFYNYTSNTFTSPTVLASNDSNPVLSRDASNDNLYVFWYSSGQVFYRKHNGTGWENIVNWFNDTFSASKLGTFYNNYDGNTGNNIGFIHLNGSSPYNIVYDFMNFSYTEPSLTVYTYDEISNPISSLAFNVSILNETSSEDFDNIVALYVNYSDIPSGNLTILVWRAGYPTRFYYITMTNETHISLNSYLLGSSEGIYVTSFAYSSSEPLGEEDVLVSAQRFLGSSWVTVDQKKSDAEGKGFFFMYPWINYKIKAEKQYVESEIENYYPNSQFLLKILLEGEAEPYNFTWIFDTISHKLEPFDTHLTGNYTVFTYTISSSIGDLEEYGLRIKWNNTIWNETVDTNPSGGVIELNFSLVNKTGSVYVIPFFTRTGYDEYNFTRRYTIWFTGNYLPDILGSLYSGDLGLSDTAANLIALILSMVGAGLVSKRTVVGGGIVFLIILAFFVFMGWFNWMIFSLLALVAIAIILIRSGVLFG